MTLESVRPLSFVGSQFMHVMSPAASLLIPFSEWDAVAKLMEDRRGVEYVITVIERVDAERHHAERAAREEASP